VPDVTATALVTPGTVVALTQIVDSAGTPACPALLLPQQTTPPAALTSQTVLSPAAIATAPATEGTVVGPVTAPIVA
jgi:hypothetical protein